ncbi:hypothetical protein WA026_002350 [Henosepilachna vigintioctopunctata]|uniref:Uncharacterized protein n=1 Tax=Henosepilachna vigintioctopunctata TaxID=420089 RepID=A0AAW1TR47_9CUCU
MNSMENREIKVSEINYRNKRGHKPYNYTYQRNHGFYVGNRGYNFTNNYSNNGTSTSFSKNAFHSRHTRYFQHNRRESSQIYKEYHWQQSRKMRREPSPLNGSEEYTLRKIQETSDMIKRKLMSPEYTPDDYTIDKVSEPINNKSTKVKLKFNKNKINKESSLIKRKLQKKADLRAKMYKCLTVEKSSDATYNVKEIHDQIMNHISKLNYGRRQNLINADTTCYDTALQQMYKQKSLELSKALREMSHQEKPEASEVVNSIIPDFAIKFEELPIHVIRELSSTFETLEKNIGNDDTSTFDFFTYSIDNQGNPSPINDGFQEYQPNKDTFQTDSNSTINYVESKIDDRVLIVNSEDADTLVIKEENLNEMLIKMETNDIEIEDDANDVNNLSHSVISTQDSSIHPEVMEASIQDNMNVVQFHTDNKLDTSSNLKTAVCSETSAVIGTVRVNQSIFENTNEIISNENQNDNPLMECRNSFTTNCNSNGLIPSLRVSTNLFEKRENHSTEIHSAIHDNMSLEGTLGTSSSTYIKNNESQQINVNNVKKPNNSVATTGVENNILLGNNSHPFLNDSEISDIISTRLSHIEKLSDNLDLSCTSSQVNLPLLKKAGNSKGQRKKQTVNSTVSPKFSSETHPSFDDSNTTCHSRDTSFISNSQHSEENQGNQSNFQAEMEKKNYFSVCIKNFQKPQDITEAVQLMFEIDNEIDKLTKLRQSLLSSLIDQKSKDSKLDSPNNSISNKRKKKNNSKAKKKKINSQKNQNEMSCSTFRIEKPDSSQKYSQERIQNEDTLTNCLDTHLQEKNNFQQKNKSSTPSNQNHIQDIRNTIDVDVNNLTGVPIICKVLRQENSLIIGTDNGKILYFDLHSSEKPITVVLVNMPFRVWIMLM